MTLKQTIRSGIEKSFYAMGFKAFLRTKDKKYDWVLLDKNMLSRYVKEDDRVNLYEEGQRKTGMGFSENVSKEARFFILQQMVSWVLEKKIEGDFAECGCWKGHSTYVISSLLRKSGFNGTLHVFDSFEGGLSDKTQKDKNLRFEMSREEDLKEKLYFSSTEEELRKNLKDFPFVKFYKGWIPKRFADVNNVHFAFAHIDVDLYQPTKDSLNFFYPRLRKSGCLVIDDYGLSQFDGCETAVKEFLADNKVELFFESPLGGCFIIK
jgi:O-methyltransferase